MKDVRCVNSQIETEEEAEGKGKVRSETRTDAKKLGKSIWRDFVCT